ncbi:hypothetical protein C6W19_21665 [Bacillus sp. RJGP41]|nr:hypothetical protein C6W19_21665 [Bacillus sp. RJGP41]
MKNSSSIISSFFLNYYVVFNADLPSKPYSPVIFAFSDLSVEDCNSLHLFDKDLENVLPALWYCIHLPRNKLDTMDIPVKVIEKGYSVPHNIILIPSYIDQNDLPAILLESYPPTLVIGEKNCSDFIKSFASLYNAPLGAATVEELSSELLKTHWETITQISQINTIKDSPLNIKPKLLSGKSKKALPLTFLTNQFNSTQKLLGELEKDSFSNSAILKKVLIQKTTINTIKELEKLGLHEPTKVKWDNVFRQQLKKSSIPIVLTMPGVPARQKKSPLVTKEDITELDKSVIEFLGIHRAISNGGVWLESEVLTAEVFEELYRLEEHCRGQRISNGYIWRSMERIGRLIGQLLGSEQLLSFNRASHITVFSDFPIGLAILPGYNEPLCCIKPISHRPLTPLTRALQFELPRVNEHYIGHEFKVLIIECLLISDPIRKYSDQGWKQVKDMFKEKEKAQVHYNEAKSVHELKEILNANMDADILVISAHGTYDSDNNFAGLVIGDDIWLAYEDDYHVPPLVILSACHVAPRGLGAVTVNDMFLRAGAKAVLGTLIPVNVMKNALITIRLFVQILEALNGRLSFRSLDEAWQWVVATNAVNDILDSSKKLKKWAHTRVDGNRSPIEVFMEDKSRNRLKMGNVHNDTIQILREMAEEDGLLEQFDATISSQGYFPESCFYILSGFPENIILNEPVFDTFNK